MMKERGVLGMNAVNLRVAADDVGLERDRVRRSVVSGGYTRSDRVGAVASAAGCVCLERDRDGFAVASARRKELRR